MDLPDRVGHHPQLFWGDRLDFMDWSRKLKELRFLEGLKQETLAQQLRVSQAAVSQWERGVAEPPAHVQAEIRERGYKAPSAQIGRALKYSVRNSPYPCGLVELVDDTLVLRALSATARSSYPLLDIDDLDQSVDGKLGRDADLNFLEMKRRGVFVGDAVGAITRATVSRHGTTIVAQTAYTPFRIDHDRWLARAEVSIVEQGPNANYQSRQVRVLAG